MPATPFPPDWQTLGDRPDWERVLAPLLQAADAAIASHSVPAMQQASTNLQIYQQHTPSFVNDLGIEALQKAKTVSIAIMAQSAAALGRVADLQPHLGAIAAFAAAAATQAYNQALLYAYTEGPALTSRLPTGASIPIASLSNAKQARQHLKSLLQKATRPASASKRKNRPE